MPPKGIISDMVRSFDGHRGGAAGQERMVGQGGLASRLARLSFFQFFSSTAQAMFQARQRCVFEAAVMICKRDLVVRNFINNSNSFLQPEMLSQPPDRNIWALNDYLL